MTRPIGDGVHPARRWPRALLIVLLSALALIAALLLSTMAMR